MKINYPTVLKRDSSDLMYILLLGQSDRVEVLWLTPCCCNQCDVCLYVSAGTWGKSTQRQKLEGSQELHYGEGNFC